MTTLEGTILDDRWVLSSRLAIGGMGEVLRAHDRHDGRAVAVKMLRSGITDGPRRFASEVAALGRLGHPNIVRLLGAGEQDGVPFLVMQLVEGPSLAERLVRDGPLAPEELLRMGGQVASALAYAHAHGVVHRDIKPSNVLFDEGGDAHVADFGIARVADATGVTATGTTVGTASYVAPEQLTDQRGVGPAADVYSLGLVLLEAATGERSYSGPPTAAALARLSRDPSIPTSLPDPWRRLLLSMTAREPASRPTAGQVAQLLDDDLALERTTTLVLPPAPTTTSDRPDVRSGTGDVTTSLDLELPDGGHRVGDAWSGEIEDVGGMAHAPEPLDASMGTRPLPAATPSTRRTHDQPDAASEESGRRTRSRLAASALVLAASVALLAAFVPFTAGSEQTPTDSSPAEQLAPPFDDTFTRLHELVQP